MREICVEVFDYEVHKLKLIWQIFLIIEKPSEKSRPWSYIIDDELTHRGRRQTKHTQKCACFDWIKRNLRLKSKQNITECNDL